MGMSMKENKCSKDINLSAMTMENVQPHIVDIDSSKDSTPSSITEMSQFDDEEKNILMNMEQSVILNNANDKWTNLNANTFRVRPKDYFMANGKKRKGAKKIASKTAMYETLAIN